MRRMILTTLACLVLTSEITPAQSKNGAIYGSVRDTTQSLLPGVEVLLVNPTTKTASSRLTNDGGEYRFEVPPGVYELRAELGGFDVLKLTELRLDENGTIQKDLTLTVRDGNPRERNPQGRWIPLQQ